MEAGLGDLEALLGELPPPQREAVLLYYVEDLPVEDVARAVGRAMNTVKSDLRRARLALRARLERETARERNP
jgi:RNA polymerase sigma-70 factor (ECF subfamily)